MDDSNCIFCKIISGEIPSYKIYEDDNFLAFLNTNPVNLGHTLVIPKKHYTNIYNTPDEVLSAILPLIKKISIAIKAGVNADGINISINNDASAGQVISHTHFHIIPRFENDGFKHWQGTPQDANKSSQTASKIKKLIHNKPI